VASSSDFFDWFSGFFEHCLEQNLRRERAHVQSGSRRLRVIKTISYDEISDLCQLSSKFDTVFWHVVVSY
jgi:hypothetical protein